MDIKKLHRSAMALAKKALDAKEKNNLEEFRLFMLEALQLEEQASKDLENDFKSEPTRSVIFMTAANIASNIGLFKKAKMFLETALNGTPYPELRNEIAESLKKLDESIIKPEKIKYAIVEDNISLRHSIIATLSKMDNLELLFECNNNYDVFRNLKTEIPDIILLDIKMPEKDGSNIIPRIKDIDKDIKVITLLPTYSYLMSNRLAKYGTNACLNKFSEFDQFKKAIDQTFNKGYYFRNVIENNSDFLLDFYQEKFHKDVFFSNEELEILVFINQATYKNDCLQVLTSSSDTLALCDEITRKLELKNMVDLINYVKNR